MIAQVIGVFSSFAALVELINRWGAIELDGYRLIFVEAYRLARQTLTFPIELIALNFDVTVPLALYDVLVIYGVPVAAMVARSRDLRVKDKAWWDEDPEDFSNFIKRAAKGSGRDPQRHLRRVLIGLDNPFYFYLRSISSGLRWPLTMAANVFSMFSSDPSIRENGRFVVLGLSMYTVLPLAFCVLFFIPEAIRALDRRN